MRHLAASLNRFHRRRIAMIVLTRFGGRDCGAQSRCGTVDPRGERRHRKCARATASVR
jgi:hypothetical protein